MATEFFDDKLLSIGYATFGVLETRNLTLDDFVFLEALTNIGTHIVIWLSIHKIGTKSSSWYQNLHLLLSISIYSGIWYNDCRLERKIQVGCCTAIYCHPIFVWRTTIIIVSKYRYISKLILKHKNVFLSKYILMIIEY